MSASTSHKRGFTLTESLICVAIIGILIAILFPLVGQIRMQAHRAASASNLRQWGVTFGLYQADHRGRLPSEGGGPGKSGTIEKADYAWWADAGADFNANAWFNVLPPYAGEPALKDLAPGASSAQKDEFMRTFRQSLFFSPGATLRDAATGSTGGMVPMCYFINSQLYNGESATVHGMTSAELRSTGISSLVLANLRSPSVVPLMAEARTESTELAENQSGGTDVFRARGKSEHVGSRYGKTTNILFADGSVKNLQTSYILAASPAGSGLNSKDKPGLVWRPFWYPVYGAQ